MPDKLKTEPKKTQPCQGHLSEQSQQYILCNHKECRLDLKYQNQQILHSATKYSYQKICFYFDSVSYIFYYYIIINVLISYLPKYT